MFNKKIFAIILILSVIVISGCEPLQNLNKEEYTLMTDVEGPDEDIDNIDKTTRKIIETDSESSPAKRYFENDRVKLTVEYSDIFEFDGWEVSGSKNGEESSEVIEFPMIKDTIVIAKFKFAEGGPYPVNVEQKYGGTVTKDPNQDSYETNTPLKLTAESDENYIFDYWIVKDKEGNKETYDRDGDKIDVLHTLRLAVNKRMTIEPVYVPKSDSNPRIEFIDSTVETITRSPDVIDKEVGLIFANELRNVKNLNLSSKSLDGNLPDLKHFKNLEVLDLRDIRTDELDLDGNDGKSALSSLSYLKELKLSDNDSVSGLQVIGENLTDLEKVEFANSKLTNDDIKSAFYSYNLSSLNELNLEENDITSIRGLDRLKNIEVLNLNNNQISSDYDALKEMSNLKELYLNDNTVTLDKDTISNLNQLEVLHVSNTGIDDSISFGSLDSIVDLDLSGNSGITKFPNIETAVKVNSVSLRNTGITDLNVESDIQIQEIEKLDLSGNALTSISALNELSYIGRLDLSGNDTLTSINALDPANGIDIDLLILEGISRSNDITTIVDKLESNGTTVRGY